MMIKALHLASYQGNIGDLASHNGMKNVFKSNCGIEFDLTKKEIRNFYKIWGIESFDQGFVDEVNRYDLLIIGGGAFLALDSRCKETGTTIDIPIELLSRIKTPIYFNSIGINCNELKKDDEKTVERFRSFMTVLTESESIFVAVRNDGSRDILNMLCDQDIQKRTHDMPDCGYFVTPFNYSHIEMPKRDNDYVIAVNLAADIENVRFGENCGLISRERFIEAFSCFLKEILSAHNEISIVFVPHIYKDMELMLDVIDSLPDYYRRTRVTMAPYISSGEDCLYNIDIYRKSNMSIVMRNHACICSIGQRVNTIGIPTLNETEKLLSSTGYTDYVVANKPGFENELLSMFEIKFKENNHLAEEYVMTQLEEKMRRSNSDMLQWFKGMIS